MGMLRSHIMRNSLMYVVRVWVCGTQPLKNLIYRVYIIGMLFWFAVRSNTLIGAL